MPDPDRKPLGGSLRALLAPERRAFLLHFLSFLANRGLPFVAVFLTAGLLGASDFGIFISAITFFAAVQLFADAGISLATMMLVAKRAANSPNEARTVFSVAVMLCLALGLVISVAMLVGAVPIAGLFFANPDLWPAVAAGAIYIPAAALAAVFHGGLAGLQRYDKTFIVGAGGGLIYLIAVLVCAVFGGGVAALWGAGVGMALRALLGAVMAGPSLLAGARGLNRSVLRVEVLGIGAVALPAMLAVLAMAPVIAYLMGAIARRPNGLEEAGGFGLALQIFSLVSIVPSIITEFALPRLSFLEGKDAGGDRRRIILVYAAASLGVAALCAVPLVLAPRMALGLINSDFVAYAGTLQILMIAALFNAPQGVFSNYLLAAGRSWWRMATFYAWGAVVLTVMTVLVGKDANAAATAYTAGWATLSVVQGVIVLLLLQIRPPSNGTQEQMEPRS